MRHMREMLYVLLLVTYTGGFIYFMRKSKADEDTKGLLLLLSTATTMTTARAWRDP